jgi:hypothetical protein
MTVIRTIRLPSGGWEPLPVYVDRMRRLRDLRRMGDEWAALAVMEAVNARINRHAPGFGRGRKWRGHWVVTAFPACVERFGAVAGGVS